MIGFFVYKFPFLIEDKNVGEFCGTFFICNSISAAYKEIFVKDYGKPVFVFVEIIMDFFLFFVSLPSSWKSDNNKGNPFSFVYLFPLRQSLYTRETVKLP